MNSITENPMAKWRIELDFGQTVTIRANKRGRKTILLRIIHYLMITNERATTTPIPIYIAYCCIFPV